MLSNTACNVSPAATVICWPLTVNVPGVMAVEKAASLNTSPLTSFVALREFPTPAVPTCLAAVASWLTLMAYEPIVVPEAAVAVARVASDTVVERVSKSAVEFRALTRVWSDVSAV